MSTPHKYSYLRLAMQEIAHMTQFQSVDRNHLNTFFHVATNVWKKTAYRNNLYTWTDHLLNKNESRPSSTIGNWEIHGKVGEQTTTISSLRNFHDHVMNDWESEHYYWILWDQLTRKFMEWEGGELKPNLQQKVAYLLGPVSEKIVYLQSVVVVQTNFI